MSTLAVTVPLDVIVAPTVLPVTEELLQHRISTLEAVDPCDVVVSGSFVGVKADVYKASPMVNLKLLMFPLKF